MARTWVHTSCDGGGSNKVPVKSNRNARSADSLSASPVSLRGPQPREHGCPRSGRRHFLRAFWRERNLTSSMTIWILAILLLAGLAALGLRQGAIRVAASFLGIVIGALLASPLAHLIQPLVS